MDCKREEQFYCPLLDRVTDWSNCLEVRAIVDGEMLDNDTGDYDNMYRLTDYDVICQKCRKIKIHDKKSKAEYIKMKEIMES